MGRFVLALVLAASSFACASAPPPAAPTQPAPLPAPRPAEPAVVVVPEPIGTPSPASRAPNNVATSADLGMIGGRPFVARSALMIKPNAPFRACSSLLTGTGGCSTDKDGFDIKISTIRIYERVVTCADVDRRMRDVPLQNGERSIEVRLQGTWPVAPNASFTTSEQDPRRDHIDSTFKHGFSSGAIADGTVRFARAASSDGIVELRLQTKNPKLPTSGSSNGKVAFVVCP